MQATPSISAHPSATAFFRVLPAVLLSVAAHGQSSLSEADKLTLVNQGYLNANFASDIAVSGDIAVIGSPLRNFFSSFRDGRAYVFQRASAAAPWEFQQTLFPTGANAGECFGHSVAIDGELIVVGSGHPDSNDPGAVYVFRRQGSLYGQEARLTHPSPAPPTGDFGRTVDVNSGTVVVGDPLSMGNGRVFVYTDSAGAWPLQATLAPGAGTVGSFGVAVSLDADRLAVGIERHGVGFGGEVRVFARSGATWTQEVTLVPDTAPYGQFTNDGFGTALDLLGNTLLVGAPKDTNPALPATLERGAAFVYTRSGTVWSAPVRLDPAVSQPRARFGISVALGGATFAAIGADGGSPGGPVLLTSGRVVTLTRSGNVWSERHSLVASDADTLAYLGRSVAVTRGSSNPTVLAGASGWASGCGAAYSFVHTPTQWSETQQIREPMHSFARHGAAVAIDGELAVVGAPYEDTEWGQNTGVAIVYERTGARWTEMARLAPNVLQANDRFGSTVAVSGTIIAIGAPYDDVSGSGVDAGSVYLFERTGQSWALRQVVRGNDTAAGDLFGTALSLRGGTMAVGAPFDDGLFGVNYGATYVFTSTGGAWSQAAKLVAQDGAAQDAFGTSVAIVNSNRIVIGSPGDDPRGSNSGSAYVFDRSGIIGGSIWSQRTKLVPLDGEAEDSFGRSVAATSSWLLIGAPLDDVSATPNAGSAYLFEVSGGLPGSLGNTFTQRQKLLAGGPLGADDAFGSAVAMEGIELIVGAPGRSAGGVVEGGQVFHFRPQASGTWAATDTATASDPRTLASLGKAVAIQGDWLIAGALFDTNASGANAGAAYLFDIWRGASVGSNYCQAALNSTGTSALITGAGSPVRSANDLVLQCSRLPLNATTFFLVSRSPGFVIQPGGSSGNLCLAGAIGRFIRPGQVQSSGAAGSVQLPLDLAALPQPTGTTPSFAGEAWHFQAWYRDSVGGTSISNFSNGLAVVLH